MHLLSRLVLAAALAPTITLAAPAPVPLVLPVQGRLLDQEDHPASGRHTLTYKLYAKPEAAAGESEEPLWSETVTVDLFDGSYSAILGQQTPLPTAAFAGDRYLAIKLDDAIDLQPRLRIGSVPYALVAARAQVALSLDATACAGCIATSMLGDGAVDATKLADGAALANVATGSIGAEKLAAGAALANLAAGSIGADKLAASSVTAEKLAAGAALGNLAAGSITAAKLAPGAALANLADGSIPLTKIAGYDGAKRQIAGLDAATLAQHPATDFQLKGDLVQLTQGTQPPVTCSAQTRGALYFNSTDSQFYGCNGTRFVRLLSAIPGDGTAKELAGTTCRTIRDQGLARGSGLYWIDPNGGDTSDALQVYCDMVTDGGGYTMVRFDDPALAADQTAYANKCAAVGMEVIVPRTKAHALAIKAWNNNVTPNLVNVFPKANGLTGLSNWTGKCQGSPCTFWVSDSNNANCNGFEPNGDNNVLYRLYRLADGCDYGAWNDANNTVAITGSVICSTNDK